MSAATIQHRNKSKNNPPNPTDGVREEKQSSTAARFCRTLSRWVLTLATAGFFAYACHQAERTVTRVSRDSLLLPLAFLILKICGVFLFFLCIWMPQIQQKDAIKFPRVQRILPWLAVTMLTSTFVIMIGAWTGRGINSLGILGGVLLFFFIAGKSINGGNDTSKSVDSAVL